MGRRRSSSEPIAAGCIVGWFAVTAVIGLATSIAVIVVLVKLAQAL